MKSTRRPHRLPQQTRIGRRTAQLLIKAGAWFIQTALTKYEAQHKSDRNSSSAQRYDGASTIHDNRLPQITTNAFYKYRRCTNFVRVSQTQTTTLTRYAFVSNPVLLLDNLLKI